MSRMIGVLLAAAVGISVAASATLALADSNQPFPAPSGATPASAQDGQLFPTRLPLPDGFRSVSIAIGHGPVAYLGSGSNGEIYRVDLRTGKGEVLSPPTGTESVGLKVDDRGRIFVSGGSSGDARVIDARTGKVLKHYQLSTDPASFIHDVVVTRTAAWFTDSFKSVLYELPFGPDGQLTARAITRPITGDYVVADSPMGIATSPDGKALIVATIMGRYFRIDPKTGVSTQVNLGGATPHGEGIFRQGHTLWAPGNIAGDVSKIVLNSTGTRGRLVLDDKNNPLFDSPASIAVFGNRLYIANSRDVSAPWTPTTGPTISYSAVAIPKP